MINNKILIEILSLRDKGLTYTEIQRELHCRRNMISHAIRYKDLILLINPIGIESDKYIIDSNTEFLKSNPDKYEKALEKINILIKELAESHVISIENAINRVKYLVLIPLIDYDKLNPIDKELLIKYNKGNI